MQHFVISRERGHAAASLCRHICLHRLYRGLLKILIASRFPRWCSLASSLLREPRRETDLHTGLLLTAPSARFNTSLVNVARKPKHNVSGQAQLPLLPTHPLPEATKCLRNQLLDAAGEIAGRADSPRLKSREQILGVVSLLLLLNRGPEPVKTAARHGRQKQ